MHAHLAPSADLTLHSLSPKQSTRSYRAALALLEEAGADQQQRNAMSMKWRQVCVRVRACVHVCACVRVCV